MWVMTPVKPPQILVDVAGNTLVTFWQGPSGRAGYGSRNNNFQADQHPCCNRGVILFPVAK